MSDDGLEKLAEEAGLQRRWTDAQGSDRKVAPEILQAVLAALDLAAGSTSQIRDSRARLAQERMATPLLRIVAAGAGIVARRRRARFWLGAEDGERFRAVADDGSLRAPTRPGYYRLDDGEESIAVVPRRAFLPKAPLWGIGVQIYGLGGGTTSGFGDFAALGGFCGQAAEAGAAAVAISPVHALFGAAPEHFSPYAPSTRLWLNPLYISLCRRQADKKSGLVNWPAATRQKWQALHRQFQIFQRKGESADFQDFVAAGGERLLDHARFEVLDARFRAQGFTDWHAWPKAFAHPSRKAVRQLSDDDAHIRFQLFVQWRAARDLSAVQAGAKAAGMAIGLIADMAVGMDPAGSHAWSAPQEVLHGLTVGAPPDLFNRQGQNWGLTHFSPLGLARTGYQGYLATLRAAMRHSGGIRLDHAMGLKRLWVIPQGAGAADGVYLRYPFSSLLGLLALESCRHRSLVVAEDLGTVPPGFRQSLRRRDILGMRVLWFEREDNASFRAPDGWEPKAAALSTTHDLPTLAGWWRGTDIAWRDRLGQKTAGERLERAGDKKKLWTMFKAAKCAKGNLPRTPTKFVDAAFAALAKTPCRLKLIALEDFVGAVEQPNIPGTIDQHPNWRRRFGAITLLAAKKAKHRALILRTLR